MPKPTSSSGPLGRDLANLHTIHTSATRPIHTLGGSSWVKEAKHPGPRAQQTKETIMRRTRTILGIAAVGVTALAIAATPAIAANGPGPGPGTGTSTCTGTGTGTGMGMGGRYGQGTPGAGMGRRGNGTGSGTGITAASGTLTSTQRSQLASMAEEEKLAHDLYVALAAKYPDLYQFSRIANAEAQHLAAIQLLMERYDVADPTSGQAPGEFTAEFQGTYDALLAGATTSAKALAAGIAVERADIADLTADLATVTAPDVIQVYTNLRAGSERHLAAFGG
jgi:hypothetical protein